MTKILLSGASGRMGKEVKSLIDKDEDLELIAGFGKNDELLR